MILSAQSLTIGARLRDVSVSLHPGKITAICGPNGAGKSTLLALLAGLLKPECGEVHIAQKALLTMPPRQRAQRIGYLPQDGEVAWDVTVRTLMMLGRLPHGDRHTGPVEAAMAALDLAHLAQRPVSQLSGGERARALLARVLAGEPDWILADEPLAALDLAHQIRLLAHLRAIATQGTGVVLVLHDLALAMNHADRVIVLDQGQVASDGAPLDALSEAIIQGVWGVEARWAGVSQHYALHLAPPP